MGRQSRRRRAQHAHKAALTRSREVWLADYGAHELEMLGRLTPEQLVGVLGPQPRPDAFDKVLVLEPTQSQTKDYLYWRQLLGRVDRRGS